MGHLSRGCLRCRQRRVRCDEGRPACNRCISRDEVCEGYRDEASLMFRDQTDKVVQHSRAVQLFSTPNSGSSSTSPRRKRSRSVDIISSSKQRSGLNMSTSVDLTPAEVSRLRLSKPYPWLKNLVTSSRSTEQLAVDQFFDKYVLFPCNQTSSPGFLEHLPCMFNEVNVKGRYALRWAVQAVAFAELSRNENESLLERKALQCYGKALDALGGSLAKPGKAPDDYDLMTVVILDMFESLHAPDQGRKGAHAQGMAQILRLRGADMMYSPRGWSLFRIAHHRIQKQQLAFKMQCMNDASDLLEQLNDNEPYARLEKQVLEIDKTCRRARELLKNMGSVSLSTSEAVNMITDLRSMDKEAVTWRQTLQWSFLDFNVSERPDLDSVAEDITDRVQIHPDIWMAYEWNYHRAARIIFLQQILQCAHAIIKAPDLDDVAEAITNNLIAECISTSQWLGDEILATVPQSLGDVDHMSRPHPIESQPRCQAIGGYLLLWPIKVIKMDTCATTKEQKERARSVFERIRDCTGMKTALGDNNIV